MIFQFMHKYSNHFPVEKMAEVFKVSRSGYYKNIKNKQSVRKKKNQELVIKIKAIHSKSKQIYGSPRIHRTLKKQGEFVSRKHVAKLMKQNQIQSKIRKKWKAMSSAKNELNIAPNLINQNFSVDKPNKIWLLDITYITTDEGWLYLSTILDLYSRRIVGLSMDKSITTGLVVNSLNQAITHRQPDPGLILHSDRGCQYTSFEYKKIAEANNFVISMSRKGNCYDNAAMETFFHALKTEHVFFHKYKTRQEAKQSIFEYIEIFYNRQRMHSSINYLSPVEFEKKEIVSEAGPTGQEVVDSVSFV